LVSKRFGVSVLVVTALILLVVSMIFRLTILETLEISPDEPQHLHFAWCISKGLVPYRDFFEHHTPWMHFAIAPFFRFFLVDTNADSAVSFIFTVRRAMWLIAILILWLVFCLGRTWRGWRIGLIACTLLVNEELFLSKTMEIRPDVPSVAFMLASLWALLKALRHGRGGPFAVSGFLLGGAVLCNLKVLFIAPPGLLVILWYLADSRSEGRLRARFHNVVCYALAFCSPLVLMAAAFAWHGALREFIESTVLVNARWRMGVSPMDAFLDCVWASPLAVALALTGWLRGVVRLLGSESVRRGDPVVVLMFTGLVLGAFVISLPWTQYHLLYVPLGALLAAACLVDCVDLLAKQGLPGLDAAATLVVLVSLVLGALQFSLAWKYTGVLLVTGMVLSWVLARAGARDVALAVLVLSLGAWPLRQLAAWPHHTNEVTLRQIRFVIENSLPQDTVLDGWMSRAPFRHNAYRLEFLSDEVLSSVPALEQQRYLQALKSGQISPRLILLDRDLERFCPAAVPFYHRNYRPSGVRNLWVRSEPISPPPAR